MRIGAAPLVAFVDHAPARESFADAVVAGLSLPRKRLSAKFFYDDRGSALFERICELPEYYLTRTELKILRGSAARLAAMIGSGAHMIEFGAGALEKVRLLLGALPQPYAMTAIDISGEHLRRAAETLALDFPDIAVAAVCADYTRPVRLPEPLASSSARRIGFFPGSTIGNFTPEEAVEFLSVVRPLFEPRGLFILGVDLQKDVHRLEAAYDDAAGVTADFNLNLLARINRELSGNFAVERFAHRAVYNAEEGRVEMYLVSRVDQDAIVAGRRFRFRRGESIHTENSYKYTVAGFQRLARAAGWRPVEAMTDTDQLFSVHVLHASGRQR